MIKSMTGYGRANIEENLRKYQVEIKSINHKYLDISVKMPKQISYLEESIKKEISSKIKRGKIDVFINFENDSNEGRKIKINTELAKMYIKELKELAQKEDILADIQVNEIAKYPDVLEIQNDQEDETIKQELIKTVEQATEKLIQMRSIEGNKMAEDILIRLNQIDEKVKEISKLSTGLIEEYVVKLEERIKQLLKEEQDIDKNRLAQEVVIFADKCSIEEEVTRLNSYISQFKELLSSDEPIGKKLDFIIQEMNRETNTIGSKANNLNITNGVIEIKTQIENIREQVQNIE
jgi:uncharacterized protein (TIGR00255 family)